jgi:hypothetical protein
VLSHILSNSDASEAGKAETLRIDILDYLKTKLPSNQSGGPLF